MNQSANSRRDFWRIGEVMESVLLDTGFFMAWVRSGPPAEQEAPWAALGPAWADGDAEEDDAWPEDEWRYDL